MVQGKEYFKGNVKSLEVKNKDANATIGVMDIGEYEFNTTTVEIMEIISGELYAFLPNRTDWILFKRGQDFRVEKGTSFKVKVLEPVAYLCRYM